MTGTGQPADGSTVASSKIPVLAQRSAEAAKANKSLIGASVVKVEAGTQLVSDAGGTMDDIVKQMKNVLDLINEISSSTQEQTAGIDRVRTAISVLDCSTQQSAALVELRASRMTEVVRVFQLDPREAGR